MAAVETTRTHFNRYCLESDDPAMRREMEKLSEHASLYDESNANGNVIIIEAYSPHWNGFGNNMSRYLTLFMVALRFVSFATYFDFGACGWEEYGRSAENDGVEGKAFKRRGNPVHMQSACQFDPGMYFRSRFRLALDAKTGERKSRTVRVSENDEKRNDFMATTTTSALMREIVNCTTMRI